MSWREKVKSNSQSLNKKARTNRIRLTDCLALFGAHRQSVVKNPPLIPLNGTRFDRQAAILKPVIRLFCS